MAYIFKIKFSICNFGSRRGFKNFRNLGEAPRQLGEVCSDEWQAVEKTSYPNENEGKDRSLARASRPLFLSLFASAVGSWLTELSFGSLGRLGGLDKGVSHRGLTLGGAVLIGREVAVGLSGLSL